MLSSENPVVSPRAAAGGGPAARLTAKAAAASRATAIPKQARDPLPSMGFGKSRASSRAGLLRSPPQAQRDQPQRSDERRSEDDRQEDPHAVVDARAGELRSDRIDAAARAPRCGIPTGCGIPTARSSTGGRATTALGVRRPTALAAVAGGSVTAHVGSSGGRQARCALARRALG